MAVIFLFLKLEEIFFRKCLSFCKCYTRKLKHKFRRLQLYLAALICCSWQSAGKRRQIFIKFEYVMKTYQKSLSLKVEVFSSLFKISRDLEDQDLQDHTCKLKLTLTPIFHIQIYHQRIFQYFGNIKCLVCWTQQYITVPLV